MYYTYIYIYVSGGSCKPAASHKGSHSSEVSGGGERIEVPVVASAILLAFRYLSYDISDLILGSGLSPAITTQQQHSIDICLR